MAMHGQERERERERGGGEASGRRRETPGGSRESNEEHARRGERRDVWCLYASSILLERFYLGKKSSGCYVTFDPFSPLVRHPLRNAKPILFAVLTRRSWTFSSSSSLPPHLTHFFFSFRSAPFSHLTPTRLFFNNNGHFRFEKNSNFFFIFFFFSFSLRDPYEISTWLEFLVDVT